MINHVLATDALACPAEGRSSYQRVIFNLFYYLTINNKLLFFIPFQKENLNYYNIFYVHFVLTKNDVYRERE